MQHLLLRREPAGPDFAHVWMGGRMNPSNIVRENTGVFAGVERRVLVWIATRMPEAVNSDHLTALGVLGTIAAGAGFWVGGTHAIGAWLIGAGLAINWFGDSLDGTLARVRDRQRPRYGYYLDHVLDTLGMLVLVGGMALGGFLTPVCALATLVAYYVLSIEVFLATHALGTFRMAFWKVGPTELRILLGVAAVATVLLRPNVVAFGAALRPFDIGALVAVVGLLFTAVRSAVANARALYRLEPRHAGVQSRA